jgi:hypothetical protein
VNRSAVLEFIPSIPLGAYKIRSVSTGLFLAIDSKGRLYGEPDRNDEGTVFAEHTDVSVFSTVFVEHTEAHRRKGFLRLLQDTQT